MTRNRSLYAGLLFCALMGLPMVTALNGAPGVAHADEALRPEIGKPLQAAGDLLKKQKYREALAKIHEADAVGGKNAHETYMVERLRMSAASGAGDTQQVVRSSEAVLASGRLSQNEKLSVISNLVGTFYRAKDYANTTTWANRYAKEGGTDPKITGLVSQLRYMSGDFATSAKDALAQVQADEKAGRTPSEDKLQLLANCYLQLKDDKGYLATLERLVKYHPKKDYWKDLISRTERKQGFAQRLALDLYRIRLATDNMRGTDDYMEMSQLALQEGFNAEAKAIVDKGFAAGALGAGGDVARQNRLRDLVGKRIAEDAKALAQAETDANASADGTQQINFGLNLVQHGKNDKGLTLVETGLKKGNFKRPDDAKLRAGIAYVVAGQKAKGIAQLKTVQGSDGTAEVARLWMMYAR
ncbi:hypothetical protein [Chitinimonas sp.]|uniref:hypothetical protein n=1 Tax=Chitinimonas sp. TaxID=1934313 RepID=UPI0035B39AC0